MTEHNKESNLSTEELVEVADLEALAKSNKKQPKQKSTVSELIKNTLR
jgi:hypothetical protein